MQHVSLEDVMKQLGVMTPEQQAALVKEADATIAANLGRAERLEWCPNPGPQTEAYLCEADELFFGGEAGGGKSDFGIGLALTRHKKSLILRRFNNDALALAERTHSEILGSIDHEYRQQPTITLKYDGRTIDYAGCKDEADKQRFKGDPHDLIVFDEGSDFLYSQYIFISAWNRSTDPNQRCRIVVTSNPPTTADGLWVIMRWAAWLDPKHPKPAKPGEIRWYLRLSDDKEIEVDGPGPYQVDGALEPVRARSRTFIRSRLSDNPDLAATNYGALLDGLPTELRDAYRHGKFDASLRDQPHQLIPTEWILAAEKRWKPDGGTGFAMSAIACDPAGDGVDPAEIIMRHGGWYSKPITVTGPEKADGSIMAGKITTLRRNKAPVVLDVGGGYGGPIKMRLEDNGISSMDFNGARSTTERTKDDALNFANDRARIFWRLREELDPSQQGGSVIALPPDPELRADLCALTWRPTARGILIESKEELRKRLGRSTGKADVVAMALSEGERQAVRQQMDSIVRRSEEHGIGYRSLPKVVMHRPK